MQIVLVLLVELLNYMSLRLLPSGKWNFDCGADITNII